MSAISIGTIRAMYAGARAEFKVRYDTEFDSLTLDEQAWADSLSDAIGEISVDEAMDALRKRVQERK